MTHSNTSSLYVAELLREWDVGEGERTILKHPFACGDVVGMTDVLALAEAAQRPVASIHVDDALAGENVRTRFWSVKFQERTIQGATAVLRHSDSVEVRVTIRPFPATGGWRDQVVRASGDLLPAHAWELPDGTDTSIPVYDPNEPLDARLPFEVTDDVVFHSSVLAKPVYGAEDVGIVIGHAAAAYGTRAYGPRIISGSRMLSLWTVSVSGVPIESINLIHLDARKRVTSITLSMAPWPAVRLFFNRVRARTKHFMDRSFFEIDDP